MFRISLVCLVSLCSVFVSYSYGGCGEMKEHRNAKENRESPLQMEQGSQKCFGGQHNPITSSITNPRYPTENILGVWTIDPDGPHADFEINKQHYFIADQEGDAEMRYTVCGDSITVYFEEFTSRGQITKAQNDTLIINWDSQGQAVYTRWQN